MRVAIVCFIMIILWLLVVHSHGQARPSAGYSVATPWTTATALVPVKPKAPAPVRSAAAVRKGPPPRNPAVQAATIDWLRQRQNVREATGHNDGPAVAAIVAAGGGVPSQHPEWCGFTQTADQRAHGLPYPAGGMQGAARAWFYASNPRTFYLIGQRGVLDGIQVGDLAGFNYGSGIHHITRFAQVVPGARVGRPPRGFWTWGGNEGRGTNAGIHLTFYPGPNIAAAARWDYK